jgi:hypothetical protein
MKSIKTFLLSAVLLAGIFGVVLHESCTKDSCKAVTCQNQGTCSGGICNCTKAGTGGVNCEIVYRKLYSNVYIGSGMDDSGKAYVSNSLAFTPGSDSDYTQMHLLWTDPGVRTANFVVKLTNNSSTGSNFTLSSTTVDTFTYTGTGSVNSTVASVTLTETHPHSNPVIITLNNFNKQ